MPADRVDPRRGDAPTEPSWHERTGTLAWASVAALVVIALLYFLISTVAREFNTPDPAPGYYLDPGETSSKYRTSYGSSTTTSTSLSPTSAPVTSDINPGDTTTTSSGPPGAATTTTEPSQLYPPHTRDGTTTRSRPRFNQTRTVYPPP